jgi:hypothetical protein
MVMIKKIEKFYKKELFMETWIEGESPQQANLTLT